MALYTRLSDGAFGLSAVQVQGELPDISFVEGADLTDWGFAPYMEVLPPALQPGQVAVEVAPIDGVQQWAIEHRPIPRRLIRKDIVQERVHALGKFNDVWALLQSQPILLARWQVPSWPEVYADDEGLLTMLAAVGCTPAQIETITAP
jgi:hypothetical protein